MFFVRVEDTTLLPGTHNDGQVVIGFLGNWGCRDFCQGIDLGIHSRDNSVVCDQRTTRRRLLVKQTRAGLVVSRLVMYRTKVLMYLTMVLLARLTEFRR